MRDALSVGFDKLNLAGLKACQASLEENKIACPNCGAPRGEDEKI